MTFSQLEVSSKKANTQDFVVDGTELIVSVMTRIKLVVTSLSRPLRTTL